MDSSFAISVLSKGNAKDGKNTCNVKLSDHRHHFYLYTGKHQANTQIKLNSLHSSILLNPKTLHSNENYY